MEEAKSIPEKEFCEKTGLDMSVMDTLTDSMLIRKVELADFINVFDKVVKPVQNKNLYDDWYNNMSN